MAKGGDWKITTLLASAQFDWAEFDYGNHIELAKYTERRDGAFELFRKASDQYQQALPQLKPVDQSALVYQQWFNAALGASDLAALTRQGTPSPTQIQQIRAALLAIPEDARDKHLAMFGKWLSDSTGQLKPEMKQRFLSHGVQVVADHPSAAEARKLVQYYADLLTEVELHADLEGDAIVGHARPFGLHLSVRHTQTVGRESGGFGKYLTNQQSGRQIFYGSSMSGQGAVNYRDDFEKRIREALSDRFDIVSITWHDQKVEPMTFGKSGWRQTPLAFVLLKAKDASVDKIPAVQLDIDMFDKQGTVIMPISSQVVLIDARPDSAPARPVAGTEITQILDQREAAKGKLTLDIKATAHGLLPELADVLDVNIPGFAVEKIADQGLSINRMDTEGERPTPISERSWLVSLTAAQSGASKQAARIFRFPQPRKPDFKVSYKQYSDADVTDVDPSVALAGLPLDRSRPWLAIVIGLGVCALVVAMSVITYRRRSRAAPREAPLYHVPHTLTPFTVIELLQQIASDARVGLSTEHRQRLLKEVLHLEERFFSPTSNGEAPPDLSAIARHWVSQAKQ